ncbi:ion channel-forming bestrophin family protein [Entomortierella parvispora]|uniref:Ion channel-forming bestrophin family protein n=1 Tax=Entomortierella parvispora TaxID=205924 RepID=A0A9P3H722_9FUNG|nr:ion channel-forming bestrophin family protein [Entomortierella parvispora]
MPRKYGTTVYVRSKWPLMLRVKGTVILAIWWQILLVGIYSSVVFVIHHYTDWKMNYGLSLVSIMGMVVSLLLVFRTNTAYDRYWEGRRLWSQMTLSIRNLTRGIWVCVAETETRDVLEKKSAINLLVAFAYATKHYLREEYGYDYDDMVDLLTHIPKYSLPTSTQPMDWRSDIPTALETLQQQPPARSHLSEKSGGQDIGASSNVSQSAGTRARHRQSKAQALAFDFLTPTNIPVELTYYIGSYIKACSNKQKVDAATLTMMNNALVMMVDCLTGFERILRTPIPLAYSIHLHHATWIYILALPFQLVSGMAALMIPAVMLAAFTLLGILGIGYEIENPFNDDYNDLPLDDFCKVIQAEVESMVATRSPVPSDWIFSDDNYPLSNSRLSAKELSVLSLEKVHELMAQENQGRRSSNVQYSRAVPGNNNGGGAYLEPGSPTRAQSGGLPSVVIDVPPTSSSGLTKVNSNKATV